MIQYGASPRATINLALAAKAYAFIQGRGYVTPQDVKSIGLEVLQHRIVPSFEAEAEEKTSADLVQQIGVEEIETRIMAAIEEELEGAMVEVTP